MHPNQHTPAVVTRAGDIAADQGHMFHIVIDARVAHRPELSVPGRYPGLGHPLDELLVLAAVGDQIGDRDHRQVVLVSEDPQLVGLGHRSFVLLTDDLADRAGRLQARHPGQFDGGLGVARPAQHTALLGPQRDHVAGLGEIVGRAGRVGQQAHGGGPIGCGDPGPHPVAGVDGDGVGGAVLVLVHRVHRQQPEPVADGPVQRHAQVSRRVAHHEGDEFGRGHLRGEDKVTLVLAVLVVDDDDGLTRRDIGDRPFDGVQPGHPARLSGMVKGSTARRSRSEQCRNQV